MNEQTIADYDLISWAAGTGNARDLAALRAALGQVPALKRVLAEARLAPATAGDPGPSLLGPAPAEPDREQAVLRRHHHPEDAPLLGIQAAVAVEIESLCQQYLLARQTGQPVLLSSEEMRAVIERFRSYGRNANPSPQ